MSLILLFLICIMKCFNQFIVRLLLLYLILLISMKVSLFKSLKFYLFKMCTLIKINLKNIN